MYLSPEETAVGKENFNAALGSDTPMASGVSRRQFLKQALAAGILAPGSFGATYFGYDKSVAKPLRIGIIGTGDQGGVLIGAINPAFLEVQAICDIRPYNIHRAFHGDAYSEIALKVRCGLISKYGWKSEDEARKHVRVYDDYRELLKDDRIEAVLVALPLHLHAKVAIAAMQAGKHVLVEKLMAKTVDECKQMARTAEETGRCLAVGYQRYYSVLYDQAKDLIKQGLLGDVHFVRAQWHRGNIPGADSWQMPLPPGAKPTDPQDKALIRQLARHRRDLTEVQGAAIDLCQKRIAQVEAQMADKAVEAEKHGYAGIQIKDRDGSVLYDCPPLEELIRWRLWNRTGSGMVGELASHQFSAVDILLGGIGKEQRRPLRTSGWSSRSLFSVDRECEDHITSTIAYPAPGYTADDVQLQRKTIGLQFSSINGSGFGGYGEIVYGTKGTLLIERETEAFLFRPGDTFSKLRVADKGGRLTLVPEVAGDPPSAAIGNMATVEVSRGYAEELEHWVTCIRNPDPRNQPRCDARTGLANAVVALVAGNAARQEKTIEFKPEWLEPENDESPESAA